jgi:FKBP-type peptidyl-prolyl cis-trans isomerase FkpA
MTCNCPGAAASAPSSRRTLAAAFVLAALAASIGLPAVAQDAAQGSSAHSPATHKGAADSEEGKPAAGQEKAEASYSIGLLMGSQLHSSGASKDSLSYEQFMKGFRAAIAGTAHPTQQDSQKAVAFMQQARASMVAGNEAAASKFLEANAKQPGVQTTPSGLQYKVITAGTGNPPKPTDQVSVNYRGTLLDGTEFDSSYKRNQPQTFPVNGVIKGFSEALLLLKPGGKFEVYIPPALAYGSAPPPGAPIPPGSLLKFEIELLGVKPAAPAMSGPSPSPHIVPPPAGGQGGATPH